MTAKWKQLIEPLTIGFIGGFIFTKLHLPLPWVLGSITFITLWQSITSRTVFWPSSVRTAGFIILGTYFGLYFTSDTIYTVLPYIIPYSAITFILIFSSIFLSMLVTKWINVDKITSVFGTVPGGLSEMVLASESLQAQTSLVAIFQTVRLIAVIFIIPTTIVYYFSTGTVHDLAIVVNTLPTSIWAYAWLLIPIVGGMLIREKIPAGFVVVPLAITATMNIAGVQFAPIPPAIVIFGQLAVGIAIGKNISLKDLKLGGKYCFVYFGIAVFLIAISFSLGMLFAQFTNLNMETAILSVSPGGIIEMVLTATSVGGDAAIVSALQVTRVFIIIVFVPSFLKWYFTQKEKESEKAA